MKKIIDKIIDWFVDDELEEIEIEKPILDDDDMFDICVAEIIAMNAWGI